MRMDPLARNHISKCTHYLDVEQIRNKK
jgi:hypothetical protein